MEFKGQYLIPADPKTVWNALNDPEMLRQCIPGCEHLEKTDATHFNAAANLKIGPVRARFRANLELDNLDPPRRCTLKGEGQGGIAGFAKGEAEVVLAPENGGTLLTYSANAAIGGKLAKIGQRLIDGAAKKIADDFFARFQAAIAAAPAAEQETFIVEPSMPPAMQTPIQKRGGIAPSIWVVGLIAIVAALLLVFGVVFVR